MMKKLNSEEDLHSMHTFADFEISTDINQDPNQNVFYITHIINHGNNEHFFKYNWTQKFIPNDDEELCFIMNCDKNDVLTMCKNI
jgi:hypothetical protein